MQKCLEDGELNEARSKPVLVALDLPGRNLQKWQSAGIFVNQIIQTAFLLLTYALTSNCTACLSKKVRTTCHRPCRVFMHSPSETTLASQNYAAIQLGKQANWHESKLLV